MNVNASRSFHVSNQNDELYFHSIISIIEWECDFAGSVPNRFLLHFMIRFIETKTSQPAKKVDVPNTLG